MLFWIVTVGSTWGAYALGFEQLLGFPGRSQTHHGGNAEAIKVEVRGRAGRNERLS
jgi:hypothetical protein